MRFILSVYDSKLGAFLAPFFVPTVAVGVRWFQSLVSDPGHDFHKFAEDYTLFKLGSFDESTGKFDISSTPESVVLALILKNQKEGN